MNNQNEVHTDLSIAMTNKANAKADHDIALARLNALADDAPERELTSQEVIAKGKVLAGFDKTLKTLEGEAEDVLAAQQIADYVTTNEDVEALRKLVADHVNKGKGVAQSIIELAVSLCDTPNASKLFNAAIEDENGGIFSLYRQDGGTVPQSISNAKGAALWALKNGELKHANGHVRKIGNLLKHKGEVIKKAKEVKASAAPAPEGKDGQVLSAAAVKMKGETNVVDIDLSKLDAAFEGVEGRMREIDRVMHERFKQITDLDDSVINRRNRLVNLLNAIELAIEDDAIFNADIVSEDDLNDPELADIEGVAMVGQNMASGVPA